MALSRRSLLRGILAAPLGLVIGKALDIAPSGYTFPNYPVYPIAPAVFSSEESAKVALVAQRIREAMDMHYELIRDALMEG